jgi:hypothetical protein
MKITYTPLHYLASSVGLGITAIEVSSNAQHLYEQTHNYLDPAVLAAFGVSIGVTIALTCTIKAFRSWQIITGTMLFAGFIVSMVLDVTGVAAHEFLGAAVVALAGYHLVAHGQWVACTTQRFLGNLGRILRPFGFRRGDLCGFLAHCSTPKTSLSFMIQ